MEDAKLKSVTPNIMVENVNDTVEFYQETLGFNKVISVPPEGTFDFAIMQLGGAMIMFQERNNMIEEYPDFSNQAVGGGLTLFIEVENVEYIYGQLKDKIEVVKDLHLAPYGMTEFAIKDCNGFILTLAQRQ
jgi:uncharacterized glyoxalase superfamily protein PhnB